MINFSMFCFNIVLGFLFYFILLFPVNILLEYFFKTQVSFWGLYAFGVIVSLINVNRVDKVEQEGFLKAVSNSIAIIITKIFVALIFWAAVYLSVK